MKWRKLGLVYVPDGRQAWARTHAMIPTPLVRGDTIRLYIASCDEAMVGRIGYVDVDAQNPAVVLSTSAHYVLDIGEAGCFDDNGVNPLSLVERGNEIWMYYFGYQLNASLRYLLFTGLAVSADGGETFRRRKRVPVLDRSDAEPFLRSAACVMHDGNHFRAWYVAATHYELIGGRMRPVYDVRHAISQNGIDWPGCGRVVIPLDEPTVHGYGRPYVLYADGGFKMFYSIRRRDVGYRMGYATSSDGLTWVREDEALGLDVSQEGWDSEMVCYGSVVSTPFGTYMFYNGNDFGRTGFGVAVLET